jgi:hypothetical protein
MSTIAFDTLKFVEKLEAGGFSRDQAKAAAEAFADATKDQLVTVVTLRDELAPMKAESLLLKWMVGFNLAATMGVLFLLLKH